MRARGPSGLRQLCSLALNWEEHEFWTCQGFKPWNPFSNKTRARSGWDCPRDVATRSTSSRVLRKLIHVVQRCDARRDADVLELHRATTERAVPSRQQIQNRFAGIEQLTANRLTVRSETSSVPPEQTRAAPNAIEKGDSLLGPRRAAT